MKELISFYAQKDEMERGLNEAEKIIMLRGGKLTRWKEPSGTLQHQREGIDSMLMQLQNDLMKASWAWIR